MKASRTIRNLMGSGPAAAWPYGVFICASGREVMFDRRYRPMFQRDSASAPARPADPAEWVPDIVGKRYLYGAEVPFRQRPALFKPELAVWAEGMFS